MGMVIIDLQKAFDTLNHSVLLEKLRTIGVLSLSWLESYLSQRTQCVRVPECHMWCPPGKYFSLSLSECRNQFSDNCHIDYIIHNYWISLSYYFKVNVAHR